jgi:FkbM family methyltransferase
MIGPESQLWKALELYGTRVHHRGKWRLHNWLLRKLDPACDHEFEVERMGQRWLLNPSDFVQSAFYWTGEFEPWDWFHLSRLVTPESIVFDVGANFGFYTVLIARQLTSGGRVFSFEPCAQTLSRLRTNIKLNDLEAVTTVLPVALSNQRGYGYMENVDGNSGATALASTGERIALNTLDDVCAEHSLKRVDIIKIDVEGHEMAVLEGASRTIESSRPIMLVEGNEVALRRSGASALALAAKLRSWGYRLLVPKRRRFVPLAGFPPPPEIVNIFALPS